MGFLYEKIAKPALFRLNPETAHDAAVLAARAGRALRLPAWAARLACAAPQEPVRVAGIDFPNPVGLAAGFDKDCECYPFLGELGFGFLELGTVTLRPQPGNPKPRLFRLPEKNALLNRMGFNNRGAFAAADKLRRLGRGRVPLGVNIGKNADCPLDQARENYLEALKVLYPYGDYFAVNISSPNTRQLRELHRPEYLEPLLDALLGFAAAQPPKKPVFVKLAPDLEPAEIEDCARLIAGRGAGLIVSNTTVGREGLDRRWEHEAGGLSGAPLAEKARAALMAALEGAAGKVPVIASGGVMTPEEAARRLRDGAALVQVYTGLVYRGPFFVKDILEYLDSKEPADA